MLCTEMMDGRCVAHALQNPETQVREGTYTQAQIDTMLQSPTFDSIDVEGPTGAPCNGNVMLPGTPRRSSTWGT